MTTTYQGDILKSSTRTRQSVALGISAVAAASLLGVSAVSAAPAAPSENPGDKVAQAISTSWRYHPSDYVAAEQASLKAGGDPISVTFPSTQGRRYTAAEAQKIVNGDLSATAPYAVPLDAFNVSSVWGGASGGSGSATATLYFGMWDFRDDYVNGSAPDDVSAVGIDYPSCFQKVNEVVEISDYEGVDHSNLGYRSNSTATQSVYGVRDTTSGFKLLSDHGSHMVNLLNPDGTCDPFQVKASYTYEHNQDGNGGWSASVSLGVLSISYTGTPGTTLRKGTPYEQFRID